MPYDPQLAARIRALLASEPGLVEMKMFGGIGWTLGGNMAVGAHSGGGLIVRCARERFASFLEEPGASAMRRGDRAMTGWLLVDADVVTDSEILRRWVRIGRDHAISLPAKHKKTE